MASRSWLLLAGVLRSEWLLGHSGSRERSKGTVTDSAGAVVPNAARAKFSTP